MKLPDYETCVDMVNKGLASPLQRFVYEYEPAGAEGEAWRAMLQDMLDHCEKCSGFPVGDIIVGDDWIRERELPIMYDMQELKNFVPSTPDIFKLETEAEIESAKLLGYHVHTDELLSQVEFTRRGENMKCESCEAVMINGVFCHETGCPDAWRTETRECIACGGEYTPETKQQQFCSVSCDEYYSLE